MWNNLTPITKKLFVNSILLIILGFMAYSYGYNNSTFYKPYSSHQWRQADCLSITNNYYQDNLPFFKPEINWVGENGNSKTVSEFPIVYYTIAQLWKMFGKDESIYRMVNALLLLIGLICLFNTFNLFIKNNFWSIVGTVVLFTSPALAYYGNNFLMDTTAFSCVLIAGYFAALYIKYKTNKALILAIAFFTLAGLLKLSALLLFVGLIACFILAYIQFIKNDFTKKDYLKILSGICASLLIIGLWYSYASKYNDENLQKIFLLGTLPIWEINYEAAMNIAAKLYHIVLPQVFNTWLLWVFLLLNVVICLFYKKLNRFLVILTALISVGVLFFLVLFYQVFDVHDYYLINCIILIPLIYLTTFYSIKSKFPHLLDNLSLKLLAILVLLFVVYNTASNTRIKYSTSDSLTKNTFFIDESSAKFWDWYHWNYSFTFKPLETIEPQLRQLGIAKNDLVISIPDQSINISLYLMNQKGFTSFGHTNVQDAERITYLIQKGAKYLIINDIRILEDEYLQPFMQKPLKAEGDTRIFDLREINLD